MLKLENDQNDILLAKVKGVSVTPKLKPLKPRANFGSISNTDLHSPIGGGGGMPWLLIATAAATNVGSFFYNSDPGVTQSDLANQAGESNRNTGGIDFRYQNEIDGERLLADFDKDNLSNIWKGNIGGFIGGLFGRRNLKNIIHEQLMQARRSNINSQNMALSQLYLNLWYDRHANTYDQTRPMYAKDGLDALASSGEVQGDIRTGDAKILTGGTPGVDDIRTNVDENTFILSDSLGYARLARPWVHYQLYLKNLISLEKTDNNKHIKENVLKKELNKTRDAIIYYANAQKYDRLLENIPLGDNIHADVGWDSLAINGLAALWGLGEAISAHRQSIKNPHTYVLPSTYNSILALKKLSVNPYLINKQLLDIDTAGRYKTRASGGLSSSQKMAGNIAQTMNTQNSIAQNMMNSLMQNNAYTLSGNQAELQTKLLKALLEQNATQWDLDYYSKAHAARQNMMNAGISNAIGSLRQILKDRDSNKWFNLIKDQYYAEHPELNETKQQLAKTKQQAATEAVDKVFKKTTIFNPSYDNVLPTTNQYPPEYPNGVLPRAYKKRLGLL